MNIRLSLLASVACLAFSLTAHASDITFNISSGTFSPSGSFTGSFLINSSTELIDGGSISATVPSGTYNFFAASNDSPIAGLETFSDVSGDTFLLAVDGSLSSLAINTLAAWGTAADTRLLLASGTVTRFDATGGTLAAAPTPEPSSLLLLGTGALGLAGAFRRRFLTT